MHHLPTNLRRLRAALKFSQADLANECFLPLSHIQQFEGGMKQPDEQGVRLLCYALRCTADELNKSPYPAFVPKPGYVFQTDKPWMK